MRILILTLIMCAGIASAQSYPEYESTTVNDFADLINTTDETALAAQLNKLRRDTGVEMTVVTLTRQSEYAPNRTLEQFATGLFNHWGVGNAQRNDGVLVLVIQDDRVIRIELGAGFGRDWDSAAQRVIDNHFIAPLAAGNFSRGIKEGSTAVIKEVVEPFLEGEEAPKNSDEMPPWMILGMFAIMGAIAGRRHIGDGLARFRKCPNCGRRGLRQRRWTTNAATKSSTGRGIRRVHCAYCDYEDEAPYVIARISSKGSIGFGGGRSGGGGASGRF